MNKRKFFIFLLIIGLCLGGYFFFTGELDRARLGENQEPLRLDRDLASFRNSHNERDYISLYIVDNDYLAAVGKTSGDYEFFMVDIYRDQGEEPIYRSETRLVEGLASLGEDLDFAPGAYELRAYYGQRETREGRQYVNYRSELELPLTKDRQGQVIFPRSQVYEANVEKLAQGPRPRRRDLSLRGYKKEERQALEELVEEIFSRGEPETDYEKAELISTWVAENIYYDYDALDSGDFNITQALETYQESRSICQGYSSLSKALLRTAGIPTRSGVGYGLANGPEEEDWDQVEEGERNHIWNEAYLGGRWVIIDNTWNSNNEYRQGKFHKVPPSKRYFDMTVENFSLRHKIEDRIW